MRAHGRKSAFNTRYWQSRSCGCHRDRYVNAIKNILTAGLAVERLWGDRNTRSPVNLLRSVLWNTNLNREVWESSPLRRPENVKAT